MSNDIINLPKTSIQARRPLKGCDDSELRSALRCLAERYPRYSYPSLHDMLRAQGKVINPKRNYRLRLEEGLQVRTKRRKKLSRPRVPMLVPELVNQRWSMDFVSDQLANGRRFCALIVVDNYSESWCYRSLTSRSPATG